MITAEVSVVPVGTGSTSISSYVAAAVKAMGKHARVIPLAMGTQLEAEEWRELQGALKAARDAVVKAGARRVVMTLVVDERLDKKRGLAGKLASLKRKLRAL